MEFRDTSQSKSLVGEIFHGHLEAQRIPSTAVHLYREKHPERFVLILPEMDSDLVPHHTLSEVATPGGLHASLHDVRGDLPGPDIALVTGLAWSWGFPCSRTFGHGLSQRSLAEPDIGQAAGVLECVCVYE